jgi:toxin ParE1/3/4
LRHLAQTAKPSHGNVALYRHLPEIDTVFVLALLSQREAGYSEQDAAG